jgi:hypothetical protein
MKPIDEKMKPIDEEMKPIDEITWDDVCGVQIITSPTGLIFAEKMKPIDEEMKPIDEITWDDVCGVQIITSPTGVIFSLRPKYNTQSNTAGGFGAGNQDNETFYNEVNPVGTKK